MNFKAVMRTLTLSAFVSLGVVCAVGTTAVAHAATVHVDTRTVSIVSPNDGGAGNG